MMRIHCTSCGNTEAVVLLQLVLCPNKDCRFFDAATRRALSRRRLSPKTKTVSTGASVYWFQP